LCAAETGSDLVELWLYILITYCTEEQVSDIGELVPVRDCTAENGFGIYLVTKIKNCTEVMKDSIKNGFLVPTVHK
jgi:hypothetical protein